MRKYILPSLLVLALSAGLGVSATINKAIQLSQDATGAFGVDTNNGVYFPGHILSPAPVPAPTVAGTGTPTLTGSDVAGVVTTGNNATTATVTFGTAYTSVPTCVVTLKTALAASVTPISYSVATTSIAITQNAASANTIAYICMSLS